MWRGTLQAARSLEFSEPDAGRNGYVIEAAPGHPGLLALALPWEGAEEHAGIMAGVAHLSPLIAVTRDGGEGRTTVTKHGRVRIDYRLMRSASRRCVTRWFRWRGFAGRQVLRTSSPPDSAGLVHG